MTEQQIAPRVAAPPVTHRLRGDQVVTGSAAEGWRRLLFPSVFLIYLVQTAEGARKHTDGVATVAAIAILIAFCACYVLAMSAGRDGRYSRFWRCYAATLLLCALELPLAHQDAFVMLVYVAVLNVAARFLKAIPVIAAFMLISAVVPKLVPSWHTDFDVATPVSIAIVSLAMFGFFGVLRSNEALAEARSEVARLATENERARIARDLHDLLGHSLTTITVKAALAHRLAGVDSRRAAVEIAEVEELSRRALGEVRSAVSGYREVTLANELAAAREVLRAAGISAQLPGAVDSIGPSEAELFGWVVREGVTNVVRHSRAGSCQIHLGEHVMEISDDGIGSTAQPGNGLIGLRERVRDAGGELSVGRAAAGPGWLLRVTLPGPASTQA